MMKPYSDFQQNRILGLTRVDMLLALYDQAIRTVTEAREALLRNDRRGSDLLLSRSRLLVYGLAAGVDVSQGELPRNFMRLFEFVGRRIATGEPEGMDAALGILTTLQSAIQGIREEAIQLERNGAIPPIAAGHAIETTA
jgi:flagellar secretion chaperone FliS